MAHTSRTKILLADDELWYMEGIEDALESEGYEPMLLQGITGDKILEIMRDEDHNIDLIILDIMMDPGPQLAEEVNSTETGILVLTKLLDEVKSESRNFQIIILTVIDDRETISKINQLDPDIPILEKSRVGVDDILRIVNLVISRV